MTGYATLFGSTQRGAVRRDDDDYTSYIHGGVAARLRCTVCDEGEEGWEYNSVPTFCVVSLLRYFSSFPRVTDNQSESYAVSRKVHIIIYQYVCK